MKIVAAIKRENMNYFPFSVLWTGGSFRHSGGPNHSIQVPKLRICGALVPVPIYAFKPRRQRNYVNPKHLFLPLMLQSITSQQTIVHLVHYGSLKYC